MKTDATTNQETASPSSHGTTPALYLAKQYGDKRAVAEMYGLSTRTIDNLIKRGMPCLKIGQRRCRFHLLETEQWMREQFRTVRRA